MEGRCFPSVRVALALHLFLVTMSSFPIVLASLLVSSASVMYIPYACF